MAALAGATTTTVAAVGGLSTESSSSCSSVAQRATALSSAASLRQGACLLRGSAGAKTKCRLGRRPLQVLAMAPPKAPGKARKVVGVVKLALEAGKATPAPPVGPALGSKGVNIMAFCKEYNARTADKPGYVVPVEITVFDDRSFTFVLKTPPASILLLKAAGAEKGSNNPQSEKVGTVTADQVKAIAKEKLQDLNCTSLESAMRIIAGTAANMGINVDPPILEKRKKVLF